MGRFENPPLHPNPYPKRVSSKFRVRARRAARFNLPAHPELPVCVAVNPARTSRNIHVRGRCTAGFYPVRTSQITRVHRRRTAGFNPARTPRITRVHRRRAADFAHPEISMCIAVVRGLPRAHPEFPGITSYGGFNSPAPSEISGCMTVVGAGFKPARCVSANCGTW